MAHLSGKFLSTADPATAFPSNAGSVLIELRGYGSFVPKIADQGTVVKLAYQVNPTTPPAGDWAAVVPGNDIIAPPETFYTLSYMDDNGDIVQCEAYQFADALSYDMDGMTPFDPSAGPISVPPFILNLLLDVPYSATAHFPGDEFTAWEINLTGDVTGPTFTNLIDGNLYTIIVIQDGTGGHVFLWPANVLNPTRVNPDPNGITIQTFVAMNGNLYAIAAGTYYP
jgi:hypothetical protein